MTPDELKPLLDQLKDLRETNDYLRTTNNKLVDAVNAACARAEAAEHAISNIDFHLDEFSAGYCATPRRTENVQDVAAAVDRAMSTLLKKLSEARSGLLSVQTSLNGTIEKNNNLQKENAKLVALVAELRRSRDEGNEEHSRVLRQYVDMERAQTKQAKDHAARCLAELVLTRDRLLTRGQLFDNAEYREKYAVDLISNFIREES